MIKSHRFLHWKVCILKYNFFPFLCSLEYKVFEPNILRFLGYIHIFPFLWKLETMLEPQIKKTMKHNTNVNVHKYTHTIICIDVSTHYAAMSTSSHRPSSRLIIRRVLEIDYRWSHKSPLLFFALKN
jgi:hypothetical protein